MNSDDVTGQEFTLPDESKVTNRDGATLVLKVELDRKINYALQQNDVPVIKSLHVTNISDQLLKDVTLTITTDPDFADSWSTHLLQLGAGDTFNFQTIDLQLSPQFLGNLTERMHGALYFTVKSSETLILETSEPVDLLARDEWGGLSSLPSILAAFVLPNHPAIDPYLTKTASILAQWTGDPSLNGYQTQNPERVYKTVAAVYEAIRLQGLTYSNPPISFEEEGQRVRFPDRITEGGRATCLDVALLAAGCLEQAGLNALVVLVQGHAFTGTWLKDTCFNEPVEFDPIRLRKLVDLHEIVVFDPTFATSRPSPDFDHTFKEARKRLEDVDNYQCVIDIRRSRKSQVRPLPERVESTPSTASDEAVSVRAPRLPHIPSQTEFSGKIEETETAASRLDRWQRKLLDLTLRNRLLNFRPTKKTLPLLCLDLPTLEDMLADGTKFALLPKLREFGESDPRYATVHAQRTGDEAISNALREEMQAKRLHFDLTENDLNSRLVDVYRSARTALEEGGSSALYLALGFLSWYETERSETPRKAPLLLLPIELKRESILHGYTLQLITDDPRINVTLLELLKKDFGIEITGMDPLPLDESGLDVPLIFRTIREKVRDIDRWEVLEEAQVGFFTFAKFLMWRDIVERSTDLLSNRVVDHLVNHPGEDYDPDGEFPDPATLDDDRKPTDTFCPLESDSSQLAAVFAAAEGRSFILEGPPGTGKSQTITNIIAHTLTIGKTVLFVSEKMAALSVVQRRLNQIGLDDFCLELHSNKADKNSVIGQLSDSLNAFTQFSQEVWEEEANRLENKRSELNAYVHALHTVRSTGESVFQAVSRLIGLKDAPRIHLDWELSDSLDRQKLTALRECVDGMAVTGEACGGPNGHPWFALRFSEWSAHWQDGFERALQEFEKKCKVLQSASENIADRFFHVSPSTWSLDDFEAAEQSTTRFLDPPSFQPVLLTHLAWSELKDAISHWLTHGRARDLIRTKVRDRFRDEIIKLPLEALLDQLHQAENLWALAGWWKRRPIRKALAEVSKDGKRPKKDDIESLLNEALEFQREQHLLNSVSVQANDVLGIHWQHGDADWNKVESILEWISILRTQAQRLAGDDFDRASALRENWAQILTEGHDQLETGGGLYNRLKIFNEAWADFTEARTSLIDLATIDPALAWGGRNDTDSLENHLHQTDLWLKSMNLLRNWTAWLRKREEALSLDLSSIVEAYESGTIQTPQLRRVFERSFTEWWYNAVVDTESVLRQFSSAEHEQKIQQFKEIDDNYTELTKALIRAKLGEKIPRNSRIDMPTSELGILKREINKRRAHMAVRKLFQSIPGLLPRLKPCLLMSPISIAQYLDSQYPPFDLVVFDEASQIPVWDAIGAIARGKQAVVVGDPKQLPPTNFFNRSDDEDFDEDNNLDEGIESILDECYGAGIPLRTLDWHYRSRHESLITFSNYSYYGNRLFTFPSPDLTGMGVRWIHVPNGVYDKGKSRTNRAEAKAVVDEVLHRLKDEQLSQFSIGIVTFSQAQQKLIEDLLDSERGQDESLEAFFGDSCVEPVFVKNLENVQGDERDVILFSICYGPDLTGNVSMNFGPMNKDGGERRLNVAITRARREVLVFSTLQADQIDLARTQARGVKDLKLFMNYAQRGTAAIAEAVQLDPDADFDSPFEEEVFNELDRRGYQVHKQVGTARYRIDLAIVDPEVPGRYLLGVECDGAMYHRAKTARDRDKLRESVLRGLGWKLHRIWSSDWWHDPQHEMKKLEAAIEEAERTRNEDSNASFPSTTAAEKVAATEEQSPLHYAQAVSVTPDAPVIPVYQPLPVVVHVLQPEEFYFYNSENMIRQKIFEVVQQEAPISLNLAAKRVAGFWNFKRVTAKTVNRVRRLIPREEINLQDTKNGTFLWSCGQTPGTYAGFRVPGKDALSLRDAADLPLEEIANAILYIIEDQISAPKEELVRATARLFGFQRVGTIVEEQIRDAISLLEISGRVIENGSGFTFAEH